MPILGSGNYLKTADANNGDKITFINAGDWIESTMYKYDDGNPKVDFVIKIMFKDEEKVMRLNKTNRDTLIQAFGNNTEMWIGKSALVIKEKVLVGGKKMDCITLEPIIEDQGDAQPETDVPF
jgi:hypothetical protein